MTHTEGVEITGEDFGLDSDGTALLDLAAPRYGLELRPIGN